MQQKTSSKHRSSAVQQLINDVNSKIEGGELRPGDYLPGAHSLAETYGVGYASVIRAYKIMVDAGLIETAQGRGAFVSRRKPRDIDEIVVCLPSTMHISHAENPHSDWVFQGLLAAMNAATLAKRIKLQLLFAQEVGKQFLDVIESLGSASAVMFVLEAPAEWVLRLERLRIPYALMLPTSQGTWEEGLPLIAPDYFGGMHAAGVALLQKGYSRPIFIGSRTSGHELPRYLGFSAAAEDAGLGPLSTIECVEISEEAGYRAMESYLSSGKDASFDLLVGANDLRAIGALKCLTKHGYKVPEDIGVLGFDDIPAAGEIGLSTLRLPIREMGEAGIHWFLDSVVGCRDGDVPKLKVACPFIQRTSTR